MSLKIVLLHFEGRLTTWFDSEFPSIAYIVKSTSELDTKNCIHVHEYLFTLPPNTRNLRSLLSFPPVFPKVWYA